MKRELYFDSSQHTIVHSLFGMGVGSMQFYNKTDLFPQPTNDGDVTLSLQNETPRLILVTSFSTS